MLVNIIAFNICWFGLVIFGNNFIPIALVWLGVHLKSCTQPLAEFKLVTSITLIGACVDSLLSFSNIFMFTESLIAPLWLIALWAVFASTIAHSLQVLSHSTALQIIVGIIFPPLSYFAGTKLSSVQFGHNLPTTLLTLSIIWGLLMVLFFHLKQKFYNAESLND